MGDGAREVDPAAESTIQRLIRTAAKRPGEPGLDLICTKVAVDLQSITPSNAAERIKGGMQSLTDASGADSVFVALLDPEGTTIQTVYCGRATFSTCNPEVLTGRAMADFPWMKSRLQHLRLLDIATSVILAQGAEVKPLFAATFLD